MILADRTVVVAGVSTGLGRKIALLAARDGANVVLGARTERNLAAVAEEIDPTGRRVTYQVADITDAGFCGLPQPRYS